MYKVYIYTAHLDNIKKLQKGNFIKVSIWNISQGFFQETGWLGTSDILKFRLREYIHQCPAISQNLLSWFFITQPYDFCKICKLCKVLHLFCWRVILNLIFGKHSRILYFVFNVADFVLVKLLPNVLNALLFDVIFSFFKHRNLKTLWAL